MSFRALYRKILRIQWCQKLEWGLQKNLFEFFQAAAAIAVVTLPIGTCWLLDAGTMKDGVPSDVLIMALDRPPFSNSWADILRTGVVLPVYKNAINKDYS